jgi:hypothetical protein
MLARAQAFALKSELDTQDVMPETQAAREALEVSVELVLQKARLEFERRQRCVARVACAAAPCSRLSCGAVICGTGVCGSGVPRARRTRASVRVHATRDP